MTINYNTYENMHNRKAYIKKWNCKKVLIGLVLDYMCHTFKMLIVSYGEQRYNI